MSDIVRDTIASLISQQVQLSSVPVPPLGYGVDLVCAVDLDLQLKETAPDTLASLAQDCFHRLVTPRGTLPDDANYGIDVRGLLSVGVTPDAVRSLATRVHGELLKDDRVTDAHCELTASGDVFTLLITITPADPAIVTFDLIMSVTDGAALLEAVNR